MLRRNIPLVLALALAGVIGLISTSSLPAQVAGGGGGGGGGVVGGGGGGGDIPIGEGSGIIVEATGVLKRISKDPSGRLLQQRLQALRALPEAREAKRSPLRKVSLQRLEAAVAKRLEAGEQPTEEMWQLAGLTELTHVFFLPETQDIVLAGPAEPYFYDADGEARGLDTLRPTLRLDDLAVALRAFPPRGEPTDVIGCSIDPTPEGLARMQQFLAEVGRRATPGDTQFIVNGLQESLGLQKVTVMGISPRTHYAHVLVSADYRMKLIGIGLEEPPVKMMTFIAAARGGSDNGLVRWFFVPDYETVRVSEDHLAMELVGEGVKLVGADEVVRADGSRQEVGGATGASRRYVESFTAKYPEIAAKVPVYAQLRNLIDMAVAAAYIQQEDFYSRAGWQMDVLGDESKFAVERFNAPQQVATAVNAVWKGRTLMTPIGGGVHIEPRQALSSDRLLPDDDQQLQQLHEQVTIDRLPEDRWWWD